MPSRYITNHIKTTKQFFIASLLVLICAPVYSETTEQHKKQASLEKALDVNTSRIQYARKTKKFDSLIAEEMVNISEKLKQRSHLVPDLHTQKTIEAFQQAHVNWKKHRHTYCLSQAHVHAFPVESHRFQTEYFMCTFRQNQRHLNDLNITLRSIHLGG